MKINVKKTLVAMYVFANAINYASDTVTENYDTVKLEESFSSLKQVENNPSETAEIVYNICRLYCNENKFEEALQWSKKFLVIVNALSPQRIRELGNKIDSVHSIMLESGINIFIDTLLLGEVTSSGLEVAIDSFKTCRGDSFKEAGEAFGLIKEVFYDKCKDNKIKNKAFALSCSYKNTCLISSITQIGTMVENLRYQNSNRDLYNEIISKCKHIKLLVDKFSDESVCFLHKKEDCKNCKHILKKTKTLMSCFESRSRETLSKGLYKMAIVYKNMNNKYASAKVCDAIITEFPETIATAHAVILKKSLN